MANPEWTDPEDWDDPRDRDRSGEADKTGTGLAEGKSPDPKGIAPDTSPPSSPQAG